jgi:hypothetical protein
MNNLKFYIGLFTFGVVGLEELEGVLEPTEVEAFHIHASLPSSRRTRNHFSISSNIMRVVPLLTFPIIFPWGFSLKFSIETVTCVVRKGCSGGWGD